MVDSLMLLLLLTVGFLATSISSKLSSGIAETAMGWSWATMPGSRPPTRRCVSLLLGSVSPGILQGAKCPVVVVK